MLFTFSIVFPCFHCLRYDRRKWSWSLKRKRLQKKWHAKPHPMGARVKC